MRVAGFRFALVGNADSSSSTTYTYRPQLPHRRSSFARTAATLPTPSARWQPEQTPRRTPARARDGCKFYCIERRSENGDVPPECVALDGQGR